MKLIKIEGNLGDLTCVNGHWTYDLRNLNDDEKGRVFINDGGKHYLFASGKVKSKAIAVIDIGYDDMVNYQRYDIYYGNKGFYVNIRKKKVYLKDII